MPNNIIEGGAGLIEPVNVDDIALDLNSPQQRNQTFQANDFDVANIAPAALKENKLHNKNGSIGEHENSCQTNQTESEAVCRICWGTEEDGQYSKIGGTDPNDIDPLISPCRCTGTMGRIHLKCLRNWLQTKCTRKVHRKQTMIKFKKLDCELCKVNFPFKISYNNQIVDIVEVETPQRNFIVFESLSSETQKIFYVINTEHLKVTTPGAPINPSPNHEIKIGRGADSDVRVTDDISVSRAHAYIQKSASGEYYINDNHSKFGTLLLVQQPIFIGPEYAKKPLVLQSGKTQLSF